MKRLRGVLVVLGWILIAYVVGAETETYVGSEREHVTRLVGNLFGAADSTTINATAADTTDVVLVNRDQFFGLWYTATSATGTPDVKIEYLMSYTTELSTFAEPDGAADIVSALTDENPHTTSIHPPPLPYMAIRIVGNAANPADTVVWLKLFTQS